MSNETRIMPTRPGWWLAQFNDGPKPVEVVPFNGRLVVFFDSGAVDVETGWIASCWLAPIPGPAVLAALAEWAEAHELDCTEAGHQDRFWDAEIALADALRAERDGDA